MTDPTWHHQDERDAVLLLSTLTRAALKWDADKRIIRRAERAWEWLGRYNSRHPERVLRDIPILSDGAPANTIMPQERRDELEQLSVALTEKNAEIERLRAALKPFADCVYDDNGDVTVTGCTDWANACRRARAAIGEGE